MKMMIWYDIYLLTAIGLSPSGSSTVQYDDTTCQVLALSRNTLPFKIRGGYCNSQVWRNPPPLYVIQSGLHQSVTVIPEAAGCLQFTTVSHRQLQWSDPGYVFRSWVKIQYKLYVQVTTHRDKLHIKQTTTCNKYPKFILSWNSTCFGHLLCPSSAVIYCTLGTGKFHAVFDDCFLAESGWKCSSNLTARKLSHNPHETYQVPSVH